MTDCPCTNCLCYSLCRYKHFAHLIHECSLVEGFIAVTDADTAVSPRNRDIVRMEILTQVLKPEYWTMDTTTFRGERFPVVKWTKEGLKSYGR